MTIRQGRTNIEISIKVRDKIDSMRQSIEHGGKKKVESYDDILRRILKI
jgi:hypothetical protein